MVLREARNQAPAVGFTISIQKSLGALLALKKFVLGGRASFKNSRQVLNALLPSVGSLGGADHVGNVPHQGHFLFFSFFDHGEIGVPPNVRLYFDEVGIVGLQVIDSFTSLFWRRNRERAWKMRR